MDEFLDDVFYITRCCQLVEEKSQFGKAKNWKNSDFINLSERISKASNISISPDTLKRLFGKVKTHRTYNPQLETKNALAIFLNYKNWEDFKNQYSKNAESKSVSEPKFPFSPEKKEAEPRSNVKTKHTKTKITIISFSLLCFILFLVIIIRPDERDVENKKNASSKVLFGAKNLKLKSQNTVLFTYDISNVLSDSIVIDYGFSHFGFREYDYLPKSQQTISYYYNFPGLYLAKIMDHKKQLAALPVEITSRGWEYGVYTNDNHLVVLDSNDVKNSFSEGKSYISPALLESKGLISNWLEVANIRDFGIDGDDFTLETRVKNSFDEGGSNCLETILRILGQNNQVRVQFNKQGCERWSILQFGEMLVDGKYSDLSMFNTSIGNWNDLKVELRDKKAKIYLNGTVIYSASYQESLGLIKGIIFDFRGTGSIDYVKLSNKLGHTVYSEEFNIRK